MNKLLVTISFLLISTNGFSITTNLQTRDVSTACSCGKYNSNHLSVLFGSTAGNDSCDEYNEHIPDFVESVVLKQVYPAMIKHKLEYGNPNIPLGSTDGKKLKTLRRLAFQGKLNDREVELLQSMNFRFNSLEDIYEEADFDECLQRLIEYV